MILIRLIGVLAFLVIAVGIWMAVVSGQFGPMPATSLPGGFRGRVLAMEFVATGSDVEQILSPDVAHNRDVMRKVITIDFLWLVCYGLLFVSISFLLAKRNCPWARYLSVVALVAGLGAAAFDISENIGILKALDCSPCSQILVNSINDAAMLKWTLSFMAMVLLAIAFQDLANRFAYWIALSFIVTALIGFAGLWKHTLLFLIPLPLLIGLALLVVTSFVWPRKLKENTC